MDLTKLVEDDDLPELPTITLGKYRHYKDKLYEVIGIAMHSETLEPLVVYRALYKKRVKLWVRPYAMFIEMVELNGEMKPRFEKVND